MVKASIRKSMWAYQDLDSGEPTMTDTTVNANIGILQKAAQLAYEHVPPVKITPAAQHQSM